MSASRRSLAKATNFRMEPDIPLAIVLDGISQRWQMNLLQIRGRRVITEVEMDGYGTIRAPAFVLSESQARRLATQILETYQGNALAARRRSDRGEHRGDLRQTTQGRLVPG